MTSSGIVSMQKARSISIISVDAKITLYVGIGITGALS
jgi:hypothetical protein